MARLSANPWALHSFANPSNHKRLGKRKRGWALACDGSTDSDCAVRPNAPLLLWALEEGTAVVTRSWRKPLLLATSTKCMCMPSNRIRLALNRPDSSGERDGSWVNHGAPRRVVILAAPPLFRLVDMASSISTA